jgi:hypothetical protein
MHPLHPCGFFFVPPLPPEPQDEIAELKEEAVRLREDKQQLVEQLTHAPAPWIKLYLSPLPPSTQDEIAELKEEAVRLREDNQQLFEQVQAVQLDLQASRREVGQAQLTATAFQQQAADAK